MSFSHLTQTNLCQICGKTRNTGNHEKCSRALQQMHAVKNSSGKRSASTYKPSQVEFLTRKFK